jgi:hypothetical protein
MGLLHAIWLYRNHPELNAVLDQVEHPADENLRSAGMVPTTLVRGGVYFAKGGVVGKETEGRPISL